jgi:hypothetical protein
MLHPAGVRHDLPVLQLVSGDLAARMIEDHAPTAGRTLIDCGDEVRHRPSKSHIVSVTDSSWLSRIRNSRCVV